MALSLTNECIMLYEACNSWIGNMYCNVLDNCDGIIVVRDDRNVGLESRRHVYKDMGGLSRMIVAIPIDNVNDGSPSFISLFLLFSFLLNILTNQRINVGNT